MSDLNFVGSGLSFRFKNWGPGLGHNCMKWCTKEQENINKRATRLTRVGTRRIWLFVRPYFDLTSVDFDGPCAWAIVQGRFCWTIPAALLLLHVQGLYKARNSFLTSAWLALVIVLALIFFFFLIFTRYLLAIFHFCGYNFMIHDQYASRNHAYSVPSFPFKSRDFRFVGQRLHKWHFE